MKTQTLHITPEGEGWAVKAEGEQGAVRTYPNKIAALSAARQMMSTSGEGTVTVHRRDGRIESQETIDAERGMTRQRFTPTGDGVIALVLRSGLIQELSSKTGEGPDEVIGKALALYKAATEAVEQGKAVGIASDSSHLEAEFVGF